MMKRTILMIAILAGSNAYAVRGQESMSAGAELGLRRDAEAKIKAIETLQKRTPAASIRDLGNAINSAQAAIDKLPEISRKGLQDNLNRTSTKALHPILRAHAAGNDALVDAIIAQMSTAIVALIDTATVASSEFEYTDSSGNLVQLSYIEVAKKASTLSDEQWQKLMTKSPAYAKADADGIDTVIENWVSQISKEETAKLKVADVAKFNRVQSALKSFYDKAVQVYVNPITKMKDATKQAEFQKAMKPILDKIEEYKKEVLKKGFTI